MTDENQQQAPPTSVGAAAATTAAPTPVGKPAGKPMGDSGVTKFTPGRPGMNRGRGPGGPGGRGGGNRPGGRGRGGPGGGRGPGGRRGPGGDVPQEADYEEKNLEIARVTRVTKGGKRMRFRALAVIGNRKGRVGFGVAKGVDVAAATSKATTQARKSLITVPLVNETIPHAIEAKFRAARILLKPAPRGAGVKAGGAVRQVLLLAGVPNVVSKMLGSSNKINNVKATFVALKNLRAPVKPAAAAGEAPKEEAAEPKEE